uniref:Uncharacterized protein n=1 Tax=Timema poppense TaxID=170557 RepID=A0A7R9D3Q7_TIMPO|nr:unnamed protein product [Timema poppensis]
MERAWAEHYASTTRRKLALNCFVMFARLIRERVRFLLIPSCIRRRHWLEKQAIATLVQNIHSISDVNTDEPNEGTIIAKSPDRSLAHQAHQVLKPGPAKA